MFIVCLVFVCLFVCVFVREWERGEGECSDLLPLLSVLLPSLTQAQVLFKEALITGTAAASLPLEEEKKEQEEGKEAFCLLQ